MHQGRLTCINRNLSLLLSEQDFAERDIQALKEAVQLTRPEAIQALKHTHGDVNAALANELAAMGHHVSLVDDLVHSFAFQRRAHLPFTSPFSGYTGHLSCPWCGSTSHQQENWPV